MADRNPNPAGKPKKNIFGRIISFFFTLVLVAVVAVIVVAVFIIPVNKIKVGGFDTAQIKLGTSSLDEIFGGEEFTVFELTRFVSKAASANANIDNAPAESDALNAKAKIAESFGYEGEITDEDAGLFMAAVLGGQIPLGTDETKRMLSFSDKELTYLFNALTAMYEESGFFLKFEQIKLTEQGHKLETVLSVDVSHLKDSIPDILRGLFNFDKLVITFRYGFSLEGGDLTATLSELTLGELDQSQTEVLMRLLKSLAGGEIMLDEQISALLTDFVNNLGTVGGAMGSEGLSGITDNNISVIVDLVDYIEQPE